MSTVTTPLPAELCDREQWLTFNLATKAPHGSTTNPETWCSYEAAAARARRSPDHTGIGFVFTPDDPYVGIDLDHCVSSEAVDSGAQEILDLFPGAYVELSPSGTGVHVITRGEWSASSANRTTGPWGGSLEVYDHGRYFTMTGVPLGEPVAQILDHTPALERLAAEHLGHRGTAAPDDFDWDHEPAPGEGFDGTDDELLDFAREDRRFADLWDGHDVGNHSEADFALCCKLIELIGNHPRRIEQLWGKSALGQRDKWTRREDYRRSTIKRAIGAVLGHSENAPPEAQEQPPEGDSIGRTAAALRSSPRADIEWLVPGVVARGWTAILQGREKLAGKGTLAAHIVGCGERGAPTVFGDAAARFTSLIFTEEPWDSLTEKLDAFNVAQATVVFHYELAKLSWPATIEWLVATALDRGHGLIVIDNVSRAASVNTDDENGNGLARAIEPLSDAAKQHGLTVLLDHHNRKSGGKIEDRGRGGTALAGAVETIIAIEKDGEWESRRRTLYSRGRVKATWWQRTVELTEDGTDYREVHGDYRLRKLSERDEWTVKEFASAIGGSEDTARRYLNDSEHVTKEASRGTRGAVYRVTEPYGLAQLVEQEPAI